MTKLLKTPFRLVRHLSTNSRFPRARIIEQTEQDVASFDIHEPVVFKQQFRDLPAISKWFTWHATSGEYKLNTSYLGKFESAAVPLELTKKDMSFHRFEAPLAVLLTHMTSTDASFALYLAQCPLNDLPSELQSDVPTPSLIKHLGRGDIYASSLWMGRPPTRTPLHRDPNPNLFVQLAGYKVIRMMKPEVGRRLYERTRVGRGHAHMRGDEMMAGQEMQRLENAVWGEDSNENAIGVEAILESGDALLIPLGWWHAVHGVGHGHGHEAANASVNWWFR